MMQAFEMFDLGLMTYFLGMEITQGKDEFFIFQKKYAKEILKKFKMKNCKEVNTPMNPKEKLSKDGAEKADETYFRSFIGCLMYLTATRPDILYAVPKMTRRVLQGTVLVLVLGFFHRVVRNRTLWLNLLLKRVCGSYSSGKSSIVAEENSD
ncbi:uncharacterized mitochondrial protein AtMg00810-like [Capsicum annuum]|uniref:uncharacterized mitochondrial protein AtMg00810-like n=1 Tax=Capsicum annuum TaxID=4072 RepID=UPI001FB133ED|nr:uncharacterized mitochondrial protein AtMg00810-like [Capsicum annuum]